MKKIICCILVLVIIVFFSACGGKKESEKKESNSYVKYIGEKLSCQDVFNVFKNNYCKGDLIKQSDVYYKSKDGKIMVLFYPDWTILSDTREGQEMQIGVYFGEKAGDDNQKLRIFIDDNFSGRRLNDPERVFSLLENFLIVSNINHDFTISQIRDASYTKTSDNTYEYQDSNVKFTVKIDMNYNHEIIGRFLYCDFYSDVYKK